MCTVSYIPAQQGFQLASNRDEHVSRGIALIPRTRYIKGKPVLFPLDPKGNGTWIAIDFFGRVACLLNGAVQKHHSNPPYRMSRGLVLLDSFAFVPAKRFYDEYDLTGIEPFTLVLAEPGGFLAELLWTGAEKQWRQLNGAEVHQWSSVTLYEPDLAARKKAHLLQRLPSDRLLSVADLADVHNDFLYDKWIDQAAAAPQVHTLSTTVVHMQRDRFELYYADRWHRPDFFEHLSGPVLSRDQLSAS
ncbi:MAG: NRDE family protein [Chitinophagales bacterium]|nr:NRDE family protein [Chitinophagales bacterium]